MIEVGKAERKKEGERGEERERRKREKHMHKKLQFLIAKHSLVLLYN